MVSGEKDIIRDGSKHVKAMTFFSYDWVNQHPPSSWGPDSTGSPQTGYLGGHRHQAGERTHRAQLYARRCRGDLGDIGAETWEA